MPGIRASRPAGATGAPVRIARYAFPLRIAIAADAKTCPRQQAGQDARAAATGDAPTTMATLQQSHGLRCDRGLGETGPTDRTGLDRNTPVIQAAMRHLHAMPHAVADPHGGDASRQFDQARIAEAAARAERPDRASGRGGLAGEATCIRIIRLAASGEIDMLRHPGFGVVLEQRGLPADRRAVRVRPAPRRGRPDPPAADAACSWRHGFPCARRW